LRSWRSLDRAERGAGNWRT